MALSIKDLLHIGKHIVEVAIEEAKDVRLEQFEQRENGDWDIVVSYLLKDFEDIESPLQRATTGPLTSMNELFHRPKYERSYKRILLNNEGEFKRFLIFSK